MDGYFLGAVMEVVTNYSNRHETLEESLAAMPPVVEEEIENRLAIELINSGARLGLYASKSEDGGPKVYLHCEKDYSECSFAVLDHEILGHHVDYYADGIEGRLSGTAEFKELLDDRFSMRDMVDFHRAQSKLWRIHSYTLENEVAISEAEFCNLSRVAAQRSEMLLRQADAPVTVERRVATDLTMLESKYPSCYSPVGALEDHGVWLAAAWSAVYLDMKVASSIPAPPVETRSLPRYYDNLPRDYGAALEPLRAYFEKGPFTQAGLAPSSLDWLSSGDPSLDQFLFYLSKKTRSIKDRLERSPSRVYDTWNHFPPHDSEDVERFAAIPHTMAAGYVGPPKWAPLMVTPSPAILKAMKTVELRGETIYADLIDEYWDEEYIEYCLELLPSGREDDCRPDSGRGEEW